MTEAKTQFPMIKWAQRKDKLFITISVVHSKKPIVDLTDGKRIKYQGTDGTVNYAFDIELYDEISKEESKYTLESRNIFLNLKKKNIRTILASITQRRKKISLDRSRLDVLCRRRRGRRSDKSYETRTRIR